MNPNNIGSLFPSASNPQVVSTAPVPEYPFVQESEIASFLRAQLLTPELNELSPMLWLVATPKSSHVSTLHQQIVRGREIVIADEARLHLLWYEGRVFIKPLPSYLFDDTFREKYIDSDPELKRAVGGFLRSYTYLIRSPSDLDIAVEKKLLPRRLVEEISKGSASAEDIKLFAFLQRYKHLPDDTVSPRFRYGDLRLGRVNFYNRIFRFELNYHKVYGQYGTYFGRFTGPFLFVFGTVSVVLSAMQVILAVTQSSSSLFLEVFYDISKWFSVMCIAVVIAMVLGLGILFVFLVLREAIYAVVGVIKRKKNRGKRKTHIDGDIT